MSAEPNPASLDNKSWLSKARDLLLYSTRRDARLSISDVHRWIVDGILPPPPTNRAMCAVFRPGVFQRAGSTILESNPHTSTRLINVYQVDQQKLDHLLGEQSPSKRFLRLLEPCGAW